MKGKSVDELKLDALKRETLNLAMQALDRLLRGEVIAVLAMDNNGIFIAAKPGLERRVMHFLQTVDWDIQVRIAEEHFA